MSLSTTGLGVPFGTHMPCQMPTSNPLKPDSSMVGSLDSVGTRCRLVTA